MPRLALFIVVVAVARTSAAQTHAGQYEQADIEYGARIYSEHCVTCHGDRGDSMPPAKLGSGQFRHASTDRDLTAVIRDGIPGTAMAPADLLGFRAHGARCVFAQHDQRAIWTPSPSATPNVAARCSRARATAAVAIASVRWARVSHPISATSAPCVPPRPSSACSRTRATRCCRSTVPCAP